METLIQMTFSILLFFAVINLAMSACLYFLQRKSIFAWKSLFWVSVIINFVIQGSFQQGQLAIILAYSFTAVPLNLLAHVSLSFLEINYPLKKMAWLTLFALALVFALDFVEVPFLWQAMPMSIVTAAPLFYTVYIFLIKCRSISSATMKVEAVVLLILALHCFNFSFFGQDPSMQIWGWTLSYALYQLLACVLPALILEGYHRDEEVRLNKLVEIRTSELASALEQKNMMVRVLTHDISNCLIPLTFFTKSINKKKVEELKQDEFNRAMNRIEISSNRISSMVVQVRDYESMTSRTENSKLKYIKLKDCLNDSFLQFKEMMTNKTLSKEIKFHQDTHEDVKVLVDPPSFINSVLSNLISNSIKFSEPGGKIEIQINPIEQNRIEILFQDAGVGMPAEMIEKVFSFNHNTSRDGTQGEKGTGFGLPILKKYIEIYEGDITVTSREKTVANPGYTCFRIVLKTESHS
jgi:signal transduction histidine kinase